MKKKINRKVKHILDILGSHELKMNMLKETNFRKFLKFFKYFTCTLIYLLDENFFFFLLFFQF